MGGALFEARALNAEHYSAISAVSTPLKRLPKPCTFAACGVFYVAAMG